MSEIWTVIAVIVGVAIFAKVCYERGKSIWWEEYEGMRELWKEARKYQSFLIREEEKHRLTKEKVRVRHNRLQAIWAGAQKSNISALSMLIKTMCGPHQKYMPDPIPNQRRGACVTKIQPDGEIGNQTTEL